jgi:hypothetical protein
MIFRGVAVMSCSFLLCLGLSGIAQADDLSSYTSGMKTDQSDHSQGGQVSHEMEGSVPQGGRTIQGEVLRVEGDDYIVKEGDGKEVRLHIDETTKMSDRAIKEGTPVTAVVNDQNHAMSILSSDRRSDHTFESGQIESPSSERRQ